MLKVLAGKLGSQNPECCLLMLFLMEKLTQTWFWNWSSLVGDCVFLFVALTYLSLLFLLQVRVPGGTQDAVRDQVSPQTGEEGAKEKA